MMLSKLFLVLSPVVLFASSSTKDITYDKEGKPSICRKSDCPCSGDATGGCRCNKGWCESDNGCEGCACMDEPSVDEPRVILNAKCHGTPHNEICVHECEKEYVTVNHFHCFAGKWISFGSCLPEKEGLEDTDKIDMVGNHNDEL